VSISVGNSAPVPEILLPLEGDRFVVGEEITLRGAANDAEEGALAGTQLRWNVLLHHNDHVHGDFFSPVGDEAEFEAPDHGAGTSLEVCLTATDSQGLTATVCRAIAPELVTYSFVSDPPGMTVTFGEEAFVTPFSVEAIVGSQMLIAATLQQNGLIFTGWGHGGNSEQFVQIGTTPRTFSLSYAGPTPTPTMTSTSTVTPTPSATPTGTPTPTATAEPGLQDAQRIYLPLVER
jgi:hypothetical protein